MRALEYLRSPSRIWAIEEGAWKELESIVKGENLTMESIEASLGKMNNPSANGLTVENGVAIIPVIGPIVKYGNLFSSISGATSVSKLTRDFNSALENEDIKAILFEIDSPGGEANGINEFAEQIYQARGQKPIQAYISGQGCSAAYWIASACDQDGVFLDETAVAGSIGVAAVVKDDTGKDEAEGVKTYKFVSEGSENKRPDLDTDEGKSVVLESLNSMAQVFRSKVARNRSNDNTSLTVRDVIDKFNRGGVVMGDAAVKVGLADGISSYREVLNNLISKSGEADEDPSLNIQENFMANENNTNTNASAEQDNAAIVALETKISELGAEKTELASQIEAFQAQLAEVQAQLSSEVVAKATLQDENLNLKATAAAEELSGKMVPAQKAGFIKGYVLASKDDSANPIEGVSRLDNFLSMWKASEEHGLTDEEITPDHVELAATNEEEGDGLQALLESARQHAQKENLKVNAVN